MPEQKYEWMNQYGHNINGVKGYVAEGLFTQTEIDDMARWESLSDANKAITCLLYTSHRSDPSKEKQKYYREIPILEQVPVIIQL